jgi:hypothetical protein
VDYDELIKATDALTRLGVGEHLKTRIRRDRGSLRGKQRQAAERTIALHDVDELLLSGAITIKNLAGQGNIVILSQAGFRGGFESRTICPRVRRPSVDVTTTEVPTGADRAGRAAGDRVRPLGAPRR